MDRTPRTIGLYLPLHTEHGQRCIDGALRYVERHLELAATDFCFSDDEKKVSHVNPPWTGKVAGVVIGLGYEDGIVAWLDRGAVPLVNAGGDLIDRGISSVFTDIRSLTRLIVRHVTMRGFRRFAFVGHTDSAGSRARRDALAKMLAERGFALDVCEVEQTAAEIYDKAIRAGPPDAAVMDLLNSAVKPLAVIAVNEKVAVAVCRAAEKLQLSIPDDVAVVGIDNSNLARTNSPTLTSVRTPGEQIGYEAARMVHRLIAGKGLEQSVVQVAGCELVARESTLGKHRSTGMQVDRALQIVRRRACEGIRVSDIAAQLNMSRRNCELQFAAAVGHSIGEEMRRVRLEQAKELLVNSDLSMSRIAGLIGYGTGVYFTRFFREHTGQTPSEFRSLAKQRRR